MGTSHLLLLISAVVVVALTLTTVEAGVDFSWTNPMMRNTGICQGSLAECLAEELEMDSESNRRILQTNTRYISYGALSANNVPCSRRGASYYNCRPGASANPYTRSCSTATQCRR